MRTGVRKRGCKIEQLREGQQTTKHRRTRDSQIKEGQVPQKWTKLKMRLKTAYITTIHKTGDKTQNGNLYILTQRYCINIHMPVLY